MRYHNYMQGGPYDQAIWSYGATWPKKTVLVALEEYYDQEEVVVSEYAFVEEEAMEYIPAMLTKYQFVTERTVNRALVDAWYDSEGIKEA